MPKHKSRWSDKEFHYELGDQQGNENAYRAAEAYDRDFVANLERVNQRPLTHDEKVIGYVKRKDSRTPFEAAKQDLWQPRKAVNDSPTAKYDNVIASLTDDTESRYLAASKLKDFRERTIAFSEIERDKVLAEQAGKAAVKELQDSPTVKQLKEWREEIRFNGTVDEREWKAIDIAIQQAEFAGGCPVETLATFEQAKSIRGQRIEAHNAAKHARMAELQAELISVATDGVDDAPSLIDQAIARGGSEAAMAMIVKQRAMEAVAQEAVANE